MIDVRRRALIVAAGAVPLAAWLDRASLLAERPRVRYDARTPQGQEMLALYARGVKAMMALPAGDPRGWLFQWYVHWVKGSTTKAAEIARVYGPKPDARGRLAQAVWSSCIAHVHGSDIDLFLPWHRLYVYFLEEIVRGLCGDDAFTMPYWDYSTSDPATHGVLPPEFRRPDDSVYGSLYRADRNPGVNDGVPIDQSDPGALSLDVLALPRYSLQGTQPGFCPGIAGGLHAHVHTLVGNDVGMGQVPWSANDPIFGLHHCQIDRVWASWNANGGQNPKGAWREAHYAFVDGRGRRVGARVRDAVGTASLHYTYDRLEPPPSAPAEEPPTAQAVPRGAPTQGLAFTARNVALGAEAVRVALTAAAAPPLADRVARIPSRTRIYLVLRDLSARTTPGVLFHVYLELPAAERPLPESPHRVGTINFFEAAAHADHGPHPLVFSFDVTRLLRELRSRGRLGDTPSVTIAPARVPAPQARPVVGSIALVEQ